MYVQGEETIFFGIRGQQYTSKLLVSYASLWIYKPIACQDWVVSVLSLWKWENSVFNKLIVNEYNVLIVYFIDHTVHEFFRFRMYWQITHKYKI